jgi:hypothetical protein
MVAPSRPAPLPCRQRISRARGMSNTKNLTHEDSCRELQKAGLLAPGVMRRLPSKRPNYDDDGLFGVRLFRTLAKDKVLENLTLPRTFFGHSEIRNVSFVRTDLSESTLCWNDFAWVDFTNCDLRECKSLTGKSPAAVDVVFRCAIGLRRQMGGPLKPDFGLSGGSSTEECDIADGEREKGKVV